MGTVGPALMIKPKRIAKEQHLTDILRINLHADKPWPKKRQVIYPTEDAGSAPRLLLQGYLEQHGNVIVLQKPDANSSSAQHQAQTCI